MTDSTSRDEDKDLNTLDGIRTHFEARQRASGRGFHALGEEVLATYWQGSDRQQKPVSAMTFRNFLQGKTTLRDPTGLELYFRALGATDDEMKVIRATLQHELDRRIASPRQQAALRPFDDVELESMPYSRALVECEVLTRLEDSVSSPLTHLTPREYLLGPDGQRDGGPDPERWGLVQHLDDLAQYIEKLDRKLEDELEAIPRRSHQARRAQAAADLRETVTAYAHWLLYRPRAADLFFSRRRYMLHGFVPPEHRELAIALAKRCAKLFFASIERLTIEAVLVGRRRLEPIRTPRAEAALELVTERVMATVHSFYLTVVQGTLGTGAGFRAAYQFRRDNRGQADGWDTRHEHLVTSYDAAIAAANNALEEDVRLPYGKLKRIYDAQFGLARPLMLDIWESDYAPLIVREALTLLISELHRAEVLSNRTFLALNKDLFTARAGHQVLAAKHERRRYERLDR
jgi:hypothetical protein